MIAEFDRQGLAPGSLTDPVTLKLISRPRGFSRTLGTRKLTEQVATDQFIFLITNMNKMLHQDPSILRIAIGSALVDRGKHRIGGPLPALAATKITAACSSAHVPDFSFFLVW